MRSVEGLTVSGLSVERSGRRLFANLSFAVPAGTALAVMGENGIGKSSLLRTIAGLLPKQQGEVGLRLGRDDDAAPLGERAHYLGHSNGLKAGLTAFDNLEFQRRWAMGDGLPPAAALAAVGLSHCAEFPAGLLSAGQKRRIALASLLTAHRPLWLLDEPATALDQPSETLLVGLLEAHLARGGLAVMALHAPLALATTVLRLGRS
ncbi:heme ABC exporter ATP-binding protein CcmA [Lichenifustis flavocetrariae]|uniref:Heme ABC exporter ATP-binding protein CcmA n=1 Tax=Lichenifustis flavocetrariae TaxID=2949735 RepID=A0AA41YVZ9_9HYPH|nr:heme ABC exporter ATP-binding protein CcmA [Lichenifustis flavocetrariae]MCW6509591.1 heme ABC exporter ATP-binding protein CcmA [Lichenifustis flavocetrariae]